MTCLILRKYKGEMEKIIKSLCDRTDYKANKNVFKLGVSIFLKKKKIRSMRRLA